MTRFAFIAIILIILMISLLLLPPCATTVAAAQEAATVAAEEPETTPAPEPKPETDLVVIRVSGVPITEKQVTGAIDEIARQQNLPFERLQQRSSLLFDDAIDSLVTITILKVQAGKQNIVANDAEVAAQLQQMAGRFASPEEFQKALEAQGMTEADLRGNIKETIAMQKVIDNMTGSVPPVTEAAVEKFYTDNPGKFAVPERVRAAHILLEIPQDATAAQKTELQRKLESIRFEIEAESITFTDAAAKYSQDKKTASSGGNLGIMTRDNMPKSFADALFNAKPGTISPVLESQSGYHILQMRELISAGTAPLEEASATIRQFLEQETKQTALRKSVAELKAKTTIETFMSAEEFVKRHP